MTYDAREGISTCRVEVKLLQILKLVHFSLRKEVEGVPTAFVFLPHSTLEGQVFSPVHKKMQ